MVSPSLFDYRTSTLPAPLQASTTTTDTSGQINLSPLQDGAQVYCDEIKVIVPVGQGSDVYFRDKPTAAVNNANWSVSVTDERPDDPGLPDRPLATFTFTPTDPRYDKIDYPLAFELTGPIGTNTGPLAYYVREKSGTTDDRSTYQKRGSDLTLTVQEPTFYLQNFVTYGSATPVTPATGFTNGQSVYFSWESNGTYFKIYRKGETTPVYQGTATNASLSGGVADDTTFVLVASTSSGDAGQVGGYQPIYLYESITVTVSNPTLTPQTVTVAGDSTLKGALNVSGQTKLAALTATATTVGDLLAASGQINGGLNVAGSTTLTGLSATVTDAGSLTAASGTISGTLSAGDTTVKALTAASGQVNGALSTGGDLTVNSGSVNVSGAGDNNAVVAENSSSQHMCGYFQNDTAKEASWVTGVYSDVADEGDWGLYTSGKIGSKGGSATITHLPTRDGHRVVTSPLTVQPEVYLSGTAQLSQGRASVDFGGLADLILHSADHPYRVLVTPTAECRGIVVTGKRKDHFEVAECGDGAGNATFDWLVIAQKPANHNSTAPAVLPDALPQVRRPHTRGAHP